MRRINISVRLTSIILLAASLSSAQEIRTVVAEGVGGDPQSAAQDAAQNALTNVVGSFIDADKQLEKRTEIADGIRRQTTQIRTDVKEYSQGSIQHFDVVETKKDGSFYRVTAKVSVRVEDFRAYIKQLAEGQTSVGVGLFAEMTTAHKQSESLAKILSERILEVVHGEAIRFSVSKPVPFRQSRFANAKPGDPLVPNGVPNGVWQLEQRFGLDKVVVFEVTATLDEAFLGNLVQTLDSVAASKTRVSTILNGSNPFWASYSSFGECTDHEPSTASRNQSDQALSKFCLPLIDSLPSTATVYRFLNVDHELTQYLPWLSNVREALDHFESKIMVLPTLEVAVLDSDKKELQVELIQRNNSGNDKSANVVLDGPYPWLLYRPADSQIRGQAMSSGPAAVLYRQRTFTVVMKIEDAALRQADSIRVKLVK